MDEYLQHREKDPNNLYVYTSGQMDSKAIRRRSPVAPQHSKRHGLDMSRLPMTGTIFTDNMLCIEYTKDLGWSEPVLEPLKPLQIHPGAKVLHYAIEIFEGIKAFRGSDGQIRLFRPRDHIRRFNNSARRACLPTVDVEEFLKCIVALVSQERHWFPSTPNGYLYIRPSMIGTEFTLGPAESRTALLFVVCSPGAPCGGGVDKSMSLYVNPFYTRAVKGVGMAKMGCNYAGGFAVQRLAAKQKCRQILWLSEQQEITECSGMNIFVLWSNRRNELELVTPSLKSGLILPGITRMSVLQLVRSEMPLIKVVEKTIPFSELTEAINEGRVCEMFGTGSAVGVAPINGLVVSEPGGNHTRQDLPEKHRHNISRYIFDRLMEIQLGESIYEDWADPILLDIEQ